jgi:hypothetical protein
MADKILSSGSVGHFETVRMQSLRQVSHHSEVVVRNDMADRIPQKNAAPEFSTRKERLYPAAKEVSSDNFHLSCAV